MLESNTLLKEEELSFLKDISSHVGKLIYKHYAKKGQKNNDDHQLLWNLINHEYVNEQQIRREARLSSFWLPERFTVMVISISDSSNRPLLEETNKLIKSFQSIKASSYLEGSKIVVVIGGAYTQKESAIVNARKLTEEIRDKNESLLIGFFKAVFFIKSMGRYFNSIHYQ
ncbi:hypothetical protein [Halalkalibacter alkalisediminis]|uniref:hypothetical protein n=1 Tax=Halalkalibacter alkalisediminis TaxID=935616 RepID=UPI0023604C3A|nr:hypothetical protein [Halalkalibacter alkalisediminis]